MTATGNFTAGTITAALTGDVNGNLTGNVTGNVTGSASNNVLRAGDAMTGFLALFADPTASLQAATKNYVDNKFGTGVASFNNRTGAVSLALDDVTDVLNNANFSTGTITATLLGNATTATTATTAGNFTGSLSGDVTGTQGATSVATVAGFSAASIHAAELLANAGTHANTINTLVKRDAAGNFTAGTITAALTGNVNGNLTGNITGNVTGSASNNVLRAGDAMTGFLALFADPTASLQAATKNYVDSKFGTGVASFNNRTGAVSLALGDVTDVFE